MNQDDGLPLTPAELLEPAAHTVRLRAGTSDNDSGPRCMHVDLNLLVAYALDVDA